MIRAILYSDLNCPYSYALSVRLTSMGMEKGKSPVTEERIAAVVDKAAALVS